MKILGIDPGLNRTGYGLVEAHGPEQMALIEAGVIRTSSGDSISIRTADIFKNLTDIITEHKPEVLVLEKLYSHYRHPVTSILMGHARGVVCLVCGLNNVRLVSYPATRIKKSVTGNGSATKAQVQKTIKKLLRLKTLPEPVDISDALAMAVSYVYIQGITGK
ncbi:MAG: crossover junction endodeoxyribonuclease RuvC [Candidatus Omnitrophica bacterium]|nr:crossover junction endodeoxyribonuclease RuvC [Candidatus Omnitrophota bacterium]